MHPASDTDVVREDPLPIGAPLVVLVTIGIGVVKLLVQNLRLLARSEVVDIYSGAVSEEGHTLAIRREEGLEASLLALGQLLLLQLTCIDEMRIILTHKLGHIDLPCAITLSCVDDLLTIRADVHVTLLLGGVGNPLGGLVLGMGDIDIAMGDEGDLLVAGSNGKGRYVTREPLLLHTGFLLVTNEGDDDLLRLAPRGEGVDLTIVSEAEGAVLSTREEANRILGECRDALIAGGGRDASTMVDIVGAITLAEVVEAPLIVPNGIAIFATEGSELRVLALLA